MTSPMSRQVESDKKATRLCGSLLVVAAALLFVPQVRAQADSRPPSSSSSALPAMRTEDHLTWIEQFNGSANTEGQVMLLDSSIGYLIGRHLLLDAGVPVYFIRANTTTSSGASMTNSFTELGDVYGQVRLSFPNPAPRTPYPIRLCTGGLLHPTENSPTSRPVLHIGLLIGLA